MAIVSSHTLDSTDGTHAGGIEVSLINAKTGVTLFSTRMDEAGRLQETVDIEGADNTDCYELTFNTEQYWSSKGVEASHPTTEIVLRFKMPDSNARYHMPIILSPNGYSTWASAAEKT